MNRVFIATSIDGYISDENGAIDWLHSIPNPENTDMGYSEFMADIDALVIGRTTFQTVLSFDIDWPYQKPVFVLSTTLKSVPKVLEDRVFIVNGSIKEILDHIHSKGYQNLYIDGGRTIQSFLKEDLVDEMIITVIPILLGGGTSLFGELEHPLNFKCIETKVYLDQVVQNHFERIR
jgi:dihydrofolate reductase